MRGWILCVGLLWGGWVGLTSEPAAGVVLGQVDDFQGGTTQGWHGGASPINVATGGPDGIADRYLQISSAGGNLGTNNTTQWTGNYLAQNIDALSMNLNNTGPNPLAIRISLFGNGGTFTTTDETVLPAGSGWVSVEFGLDDLTLTQTSGNGTLNDTLATVNTVLIRHDPDPLSPSGQMNPVVGTLGIDNITALPEPGSGWLRVAGVAALVVAARARGRARTSASRS
jgi:hypothetical protein